MYVWMYDVMGFEVLFLLVKMIVKVFDVVLFDGDYEMLKF